MTVLDYLISKGMYLKDSGAQEWKTKCIFCGKEDHLYISKANGLWKCHSGNCNRYGSLSSLKKHFGDVNHITSLNEALFPKIEKAVVTPEWDKYKHSMELLLNDAVQLKWLDEERGINLETVTNFKLGLKGDKFSPRNNAKISWIEMPLVAGGQFVNVKFRSSKEFKKDFSFVTGCPLTLFNHDGVEKEKPIILCEGEFDAMVLWQRGFKNVLSTTGGAGTFKSEWYDYIKSLNPQIIYVVYDSDAPGQKGAKEICTRFDTLARNIVLPEGKDPTEYFVTLKHSAEEFQQLLDNAALSDVEYVYTTSAIIDSAIAELQSKGDAVSGLVTPFPNVNKLIGGSFEPGELIVLSARAKVGKTTFAQYITFQMAKNSNVPVLFMCLEMRPERVVKKMICSYLNKNTEELTVEDYIKSKEGLKDVPFYFSYFWDNVTMDVVEKVFTQARRRYGIKIGVFDNLHFLCRSKDNLTQEIGILSKRFKVLAEKLEIPIILIVQPRRVGRNDIPSSEDLKDSSAIKADADKVLIMHRVPIVATTDVGVSNEIVEAMIAPLEESLHPITMIKCDATRFSSGGTTSLWYDGSKSIFRETTFKELEEFKELYAKQPKKEYQQYGKSSY